LRNEEDVRGGFNSNICLVLNVLIGPDYEFSRESVPAPGEPDFSCYHDYNKLILAIEIKKVHILKGINEQTLPEFYETNSNVKKVIQQVYNYITDNQLQYSILSTYDHHWFIRRPSEAPATLYISETLPLQSTSPPVLKAYAYIALQARDHPDSLNPKIILEKDKKLNVTNERVDRVTRSMVSGKDSNKASSSNNSAKMPNQRNFSFADFKFKRILGQGRSGKTLLSEF
ncbi:563_t:CDS:1, partial [Ambispora gerdemannii]